MKELLNFIFLFLLNSYFTVGQLVILDKKDRSPIPFVHFLSTKGNLIATSNLEGIVVFNENHDNDTISVQHLSYHKLKTSIGNLKIKDTIFLEEKVNLLSEVIIKPRNNRSVIVLKGYFRSYEINDNTPKFYTDGIVEYYIKRNNVKMKLLDYRAYENEELVKREKQRTNMVVMRLATVPRINHNTIRDAIKTKKYTIENVAADIMEIRKESSVVGTIKHDNSLNIITLNMDFIKPNDSNSKTLFNYTSKIVNNVLTEIYSNENNDKISIKSILGIKGYRRIFFKHKKDDLFTELQGITELFIIKKSLFNKDDYKKIKSSSYAFPESTSHTYEYWNNLKEFNIPELNENIERTIKKTLKKL